jgi:hypothetical protein
MTQSLYFGTNTIINLSVVRICALDVPYLTKRSSLMFLLDIKPPTVLILSYKGKEILKRLCAKSHVLRRDSSYSTKTKQFLRKSEIFPLLRIPIFLIFKNNSFPYFFISVRAVFRESGSSIQNTGTNPDPGFC